MTTRIRRHRCQETEDEVSPSENETEEEDSIVDGELDDSDSSDDCTHTPKYG